MLNSTVTEHRNGLAIFSMTVDAKNVVTTHVEDLACGGDEVYCYKCATNNQTLRLMRKMMSQCSRLFASFLPLLERKSFIYEFSFILGRSFVSSRYLLRSLCHCENG